MLSKMEQALLHRRPVIEPSDKNNNLSEQIHFFIPDWLIFCSGYVTRLALPFEPAVKDILFLVKSVEIGQRTTGRQFAKSVANHARG